ncbi:hypothetical protein [Geoanaerobacter pelophilus]|nr:hypothetical protein [Geoanaerobacter pelophilus]
MQKPVKKTKKRQNCTHMTGAELKRLRREIGIGTCDMYRLLGLPRRTYQDYEAGKRGIPEAVATAAREAHRRDREFFATLPDRIDARLLEQFPDGIIK